MTDQKTDEVLKVVWVIASQGRAGLQSSVRGLILVTRKTKFVGLAIGELRTKGNLKVQCKPAEHIYLATRVSVG